MRVLLLADLHSRASWFEWLSQQKADLVVIAGDLLDGFQSKGLLPQMLSLADWCARFKGELAISSGNHDGNEPRGSFDPASLAQLPEEKGEAIAAMIFANRWMDTLDRPSLVTDGRTGLVSTPGGAVVVTTIPYHSEMTGEPLFEELWSQGSRLRKTHKVPWIVLHHEPPADTNVGGMMGNLDVVSNIHTFRPDFVASGHLHDQPYRGSFADNIAGTWCFNPGHPLPDRAAKSKIPNHIVLDLCARKATWNAAPNIGRFPLVKHVRLA